MEKNVGIDFGTTNTVVYIRRPDGKLIKIKNAPIKSAIYFITRDDYVIGKEALNRLGEIKNSQALITNFKPNIKEKFTIIAENGESFKLKGEVIAKLFLSKVLSDYIEIRLKKYFDSCEMGEDDKTVITVPAKFDVEKKAKIKKAATNAMFSNVGIAFEPTAAAIAALGTDIDDDIIAVYDFGGGTFDVSVIEKGLDGHYLSVDEDGDSNLGGNRISQAIADQIVLPIIRDSGIEIYDDIDDMEFDDEDSMTESEYIFNKRSIYSLIENLKECLVEEEKYSGKVSIIQNNIAYDDIIIEVSKDKFNDVIKPYVQKTVDITRRVVEKVRSKNKFVKKIIMAGGSSQLSIAEKLLKDEFEHEGIEVVLSDEVFDLIAKGALFMAEQQKLVRVEEKTATQFGIGVRTGVGIKKFEKLIDVNVSLPVSGSKNFKIDKRILEQGIVEIPCYEKDINNYPNSNLERDKGINYINTYKIPIDKNLNPDELNVEFTIECDGTLSLSVKLFDTIGREIKEFNADIQSDSEIE